MYIYHDRSFWIYFIMILFFTILGIWILIISGNRNSLFIGSLWVLSNLLLLYLSYIINKVVVNVIYLNILLSVILLSSLFWVGSTSNNNVDTTDTISGVLIILASIILLKMIPKYSNLFWGIMGYIFLWIFLSLYKIL